MRKEREPRDGTGEAEEDERETTFLIRSIHRISRAKEMNGTRAAVCLYRATIKLNSKAYPLCNVAYNNNKYICMWIESACRSTSSSWVDLRQVFCCTLRFKMHSAFHYHIAFAMIHWENSLWIYSTHCWFVFGAGGSLIKRRWTNYNGLLLLPYPHKCTNSNQTNNLCHLYGD